MRKRLSVEYGINISAGRVSRLMKGMQLPKMSTVKPKAPAHKAVEETAGSYPNILQRKFYPNVPNEIWASDITYIRVGKGFCYVCVIIDLFSRKVISSEVSTRIDTALVLRTFIKACAARDNPHGAVFHSDRGRQYTSITFRKELNEKGFTQSFSSKGCPYDNAVVESFFKYLKHEELSRRKLQTIEDLKISLSTYIEGYYNKLRPHSANENLTPEEKEMEYYSALKKTH